MRMTEFFSYVNDDMPTGYLAYHLDMTVVKHNKEVKALKKAIRKRRKDEEKFETKGKKDGTEDVDIFG